MVAPGWYDDPHGGGGYRWWDGERWTEHTAPAVQPPAPPMPPGASQAAAAPAAAAPGAPAGDAGKSGGGGKLFAILAGVVVLLVVIGVAVWALLGGGGDVEGGDTIAEGDSAAFEVAEDGSWELEFTAPGGAVVIDVRGEGGFDPVAELLDADTGALIERNDDRSGGQQDRYGGGGFDALLEVELPAGEYRLVVTGFGGQGGSGVVTFPVVGGDGAAADDPAADDADGGAVALGDDADAGAGDDGQDATGDQARAQHGGVIAEGDSATFEVVADGSWELTFDAPGGLMVIDVRGAGGFDPVAELLDADTGVQIERNDDRSGGQQDRYGGGGFDAMIERELPAGEYRLVVTGFVGEGGDGAVTFPVVGGEGAAADDGAGAGGGSAAGGDVADAVDGGTIAEGDAFDFEVTESRESWALDFAAPGGPLVIDIRGQDGFDPVVELLDADTGVLIERNDDRSTGQRDRYGGDWLDAMLELDLAAGEYRLVVSGFGGWTGGGVVTFPAPAG